MNTFELNEFCKGKIGTVYIARRGTVTVIEIEGTSYLVNNVTAPSGVVVNPADNYWIHAIDWAGGFTDYFCLGMEPDENPRIEAAPILAITNEQKIHLRAIADKWRQKKAKSV
jgi:hypothetical protein